VPQAMQSEARHFQTFEPREVVAVTKVAWVERSAKFAHEQQSAVPVLRPEFEMMTRDAWIVWGSSPHPQVNSDQRVGLCQFRLGK